MSRYLLNRPYKDPAMMVRPTQPTLGGPVSPARAEELRASWRGASDAWFGDPRRTDEELHAWTTTFFLPDHPELRALVDAGFVECVYPHVPSASSLSSGERTHG